MNRAETFKSVWTNPIGIRAMLWAKLPLAAFAGLRLRKLDDTGAQVSLPAGWKTQNPFRSTYFAAQAMAAEMSTGVPALYFIEQSGAQVSSLVTGLSAKFTKKATQESAHSNTGLTWGKTQTNSRGTTSCPLPNFPRPHRPDSLHTLTS